MSLSFAFIIPLNYQINVKNNLYLPREQVGPSRFVLPLLTFKPEVPEHRRFVPNVNFFFKSALFLGILMITAFLYICFPYPIYMKIQPKYAKIIENWRLKRSARPTSCLCVPPAQESIPGNDGNLAAESKRAGNVRILHP